MSDNKGLMAGKRGLIMGVANNRSIAVGVSKDRRKRLDFSIVSADREVLQKCGVNFIGVRNVTQITNAEGRPEKTANAAGIIPPSHARPVLEFLKGQCPLTRQHRSLPRMKLFLTPLFLCTTGLKKIQGFLSG